MVDVETCEHLNTDAYLNINKRFKIIDADNEIATTEKI